MATMRTTTVPTMTMAPAMATVTTSSMATRLLTQGDMDDIGIGFLNHLTLLPFLEFTVGEFLGRGGELQLEALADPFAIVTDGIDPSMTLASLSNGLGSWSEVFLAEEEGCETELEAGIGRVVPPGVGLGDDDVIDGAVCLGALLLLLCLTQSGEEEEGTDGSVD